MYIIRSLVTGIALVAIVAFAAAAEQTVRRPTRAAQLTGELTC